MISNEQLDILTSITGDPFVDTGGRVIKFLSQQPQFKDKELLDLVKYVADVYIDSWEGKIHPFFLNSTITQPSINTPEKRRKVTYEYYSRLVNKDTPDTYGTCMVTGIKGPLYFAGRHNHILSGSFKYVNFYYYLQPGLLFSAEVLIRTFFVPFGVVRIAHNLGIIISNNPGISDLFVFKNCADNMNALALGESKNAIKSPYNNPASCLFKFIDNFRSIEMAAILRKLEKESIAVDPKSTSLYLYHFNNMGQKPELYRHNIHTKLFDFYMYCTGFGDDWRRFENAFVWFDKECEYNEEDGLWYKDGEPVKFEEYAKWRNYLLLNLLSSKNILWQFRKYTERTMLPWDIIAKYQTQIRNMHPKALEVIKRIGAQVHKDTDDGCKKVLQSLNECISRNELRQRLLKLMKAGVTDDAPHLLFTLEEMTSYLLPAGRSWKETRDLLVVCIYENIHSQKNKSNE